MSRRSRPRGTSRGVATLVLALSLAGLPAPGAAQARSPRVAVQVVDEEGQGLPGVQLTFRDAGQPDSEALDTTSQSGTVAPVERVDGTKLEIVPELAGYQFEPPMAAVLVEQDLEVVFKARRVEGADFPAPGRPAGAAARRLVKGIVLEAFTYPDGSVNEIALEGVTLFLSGPGRDDRPRVSDENGEFEAFEVEPGEDYELEPVKEGYRFSPEFVSVHVGREDLFLTFTGRKDQLAEPPRREPAVPSSDGAPPLPGPGRRNLRVPDLKVPGGPDSAQARRVPGAPRFQGDRAPRPDRSSSPPAVVAVQVTVRVPGPGGQIHEVGIDARVEYRNVEQTSPLQTVSRRATGGLAEPYPVAEGSVLEIAAFTDGYRFPVARVTAGPDETFVPIVGELDPDVSCSIGGKINDESNRYVWRFLRVSLYDAQGNYVRGRDASLDEQARYRMRDVPPGFYTVRVTPGRADTAYTSRPRERSFLCVNNVPLQDFTVR